MTSPTSVENHSFGRPCAEASDELFGGDDGIGSGSNMHFDPVGWHATGTLQVGGRGPRVRILDASNGLVVSWLAWLTVVLLLFESLFFV